MSKSKGVKLSKAEKTDLKKQKKELKKIKAEKAKLQKSRIKNEKKRIRQEHKNTKKSARAAKKLKKYNEYVVESPNVLYRDQLGQKEIAKKFQQIVQGAPSGCSIEMHRVPDEVMVGDKKTQFSFRKIIIRTQDDISSILDGQGLKYKQRDHTKTEIMHGSKGAEFANGSHLECFALYEPTARIPTSWLSNNLFSQCHFVKVFIKHVPLSRRNITLSKMGIEQQGKSHVEKIDSTTMVKEIRQKVAEGNTLIEARVIAGVVSYDVDELKSFVKEFDTWSKSTNMTFHRIPGATKSMYEKGGPYKFILEAGSTYALMPFFVSDLYEQGGIVLGQNIDTGAPVRYNWRNRPSPHISIVAPSGSGKSVAMKIIITRLLAMHQDAFVFIADLENEYVKFGKENGFGIINIEPQKQLGLDPFKYLPGYTAAEMIAHVTGAPILAQNEMIAIGGGKDCDTTVKLYDKLVEYDKENDTKHAGYMRNIVSEPILSMISGQSSFTEKTIIAMNKTIKARSAPHRFLTMLTLQYVMEKAQKAKNQFAPKIVVMDEFWSAIAGDKDSGMLDYVEDIIRRGRKYNIIFIFATQNIADVLLNPDVKSLFVNTGCQIYMGQKEEEVDSLRTILHMPENEITTLLAAKGSSKRGEGVMHVDDDRIHLKFMATPEEMKIFGTTSTEEGQNWR